MTESEYVRVNVTSATAVQRDDGYGNVLAEVDMQLPTNLLNSADEVESARMAVMKMQVPLTDLPAVTVPVTGWSRNPVTGVYTVDLPMKVLIVPYDILRGETTISDTCWIHDGVYPRPVTLYTNTVYNETMGGVNPGQYEYRRGYHEFPTMQKFMQLFSFFVRVALGASFNFDDIHFVGNFKQVAEPRFQVHSDNTISLRVTGVSTGNLVPYGYNSGNRGTFLMFDDGNHSPNTFHPYYIAANEELRNALPTLPWVRCQLPSWVNSGDWDDSQYMYILETSAAEISREVGNYEFTRAYGTSDPTLFKGTVIDYHFAESDAITNVDINSIVLCMNGVAFNQQVYPVNYSVTTARQAQTGTIPIIEVYYPLWQRPSDKTGMLIIKNETFSDAAPIKINPSLLRERNIKFKLMCITSRGVMKEMSIPKNLPFTFQIAFELTRRRRP